jgi:4-amino-4-deoxy-L-arabinose transferase-like glycosyltransferase
MTITEPAVPPRSAQRAATLRLVQRLPWPLLVLTGVAAALRLSSLSAVHPNEFYDAAVRSMSLSPGNFLFGAFEPGRALSIDKPPLDLWLQVISTGILGWGGFALKLPEALAGIAAVPLLYDTVRRVAGVPAALAAGTVLALAPEPVLTSRSDTMDAVMMLLVLAALWLAVRACQGGGRRDVILCGAALGLGFEVKLLEALLCLPGLIVLLWLGLGTSWRRRAVDLALGGAALALVGVAWAVIVSLAPGRHPWPVGSSDGTVWNAMFVFNGVGKVSGLAADRPGGPGPLRLLVSTGWHYDRLFGCVLAAALAIGLGALLNLALRGRVRLNGRLSLLKGRLSLPAAFAAATAAWIVADLFVFDTMSRVHARYLEAFDPALAMAIGLGAAELAGFGAGGRPERRPAVLRTALALGCVGAYAFHFHLVSTSWGSLALLMATVGAALLGSAPGIARAAARWLVAGLIVACALAVPGHETLSVLRSDANDSLGLAVIPTADARVLSSYLAPRTRGLRYEVAADEPLALAPLIISDARPIVPLTSFGGRPLVSRRQLEADVRAGSVRYGLVSNYTCTGHHRRWAACTSAALWIRSHGTDVSAQAGLRGRLRLYRLSSVPAP